MILPPHYSGRTVALLGLAATGRSVARALMAAGAGVLGWDDAERARDEAANLGVDVSAPADWNWSEIASLIVAPGVPITHPAPHPVVAAAQAAGVEVIGDVELFARAIAAAPTDQRPRIVAITGTNGKSTTTALLGHILRAAGQDARVGGNIGTPVLDLAPWTPGAIYVLEVSSFQLESTSSLKPDIAVWMNLSPDHLDRHGDMAGYAAAKRRILARQTSADHAVIGVDDDFSHGLAEALSTRPDAPHITRISAQIALADGVHAVGGLVFDGLDGSQTGREAFADLAHARALAGAHNAQNAAAAVAAARLLGVERDIIARALMDFPGLVHRLEWLATIKGVRFINDSKATNTDAARHALGAFERIFWIAGGRSKGERFDSLIPFMPRIARGYLIGEMADALQQDLGGHAPLHICGTLEAAVSAAAADAWADGGRNAVVLLAPACASFDQFAGFAARGEAFRALVAQLVGGADPAMVEQPPTPPGGAAGP